MLENKKFSNPVKRLSFVSRMSLLVATFFGVDKVLAFARSIIIARQFGFSLELDAFNVANNLPDLLFAMISGGALAMAFIPIFTEHVMRNGREDAWLLFSRIANLAFVFTAGAAVIVAIFADQIVTSQFGIAPGFGPAQQQLVAQLMRLNLVATIIFSISGLVMAGLQANQHFLLPAMAPALYNIGQIFGALVLVPVFGVYGLVYGVILGALMHLGIQIPGLIKYHFHWTPSLTLRDKGVRDMLRVAGPRLLTMLFIQSTFIMRDNFASRLDQVGAVSALTYGWMIMQVPETLLGTAIATAILPTLSEHMALANGKQFRDAVERAAQVMLAMTIPVALIAIVVLPYFVGAVFGLDETDAAMLTRTSQVYMLTLTGYAMQELMARSFYARKEAWVPLRGVLVRSLVYFVIAITVITNFPQWGPAGLALAELAAGVEAVAMLFWLNRRVEPSIQIYQALIRGGLAGLLAALVAFGFLLWLPVSGMIAAMIASIIAAAASLTFIRPYLKLMLRL